MRINAFCTASPKLAAEHCDSVLYCGDGKSGSGATVYAPFSVGATAERIYLPSMLAEGDFEAFCDHIVSTSATAIVRASFDLEEAGLIEARYNKLSPIMLLHKMGVLDRCTIVGGVCLDNDDLDLMAQEGVPLVVTPTASAGYGHGFAPVCAAIRRGIRVGVGTFDGKYNAKHDLGYEMMFLRLTANAEMRTENAVSDAEADKILSFVK